MPQKALTRIPARQISFQANISGLTVSFTSYDERIEYIQKYWESRDAAFTIGYANAYSVLLAKKDKEFRNALNNLSVIFADGVGVRLAGKALGDGTTVIAEQNATDFNYAFLKYADENKLKIFFLGGTERILQRVTVRIEQEYSGISLVGVHHGYVDVKDDAIIRKINETHPDILFVGMGQPMQELWINAHHSSLNVPVISLVGGFLNFFSGEKRRASKGFRVLGLEWMHRLILEPRRLWKRYIFGIPHFCFVILKQKFKR